MNIDLISAMRFGDPQGLADFLLQHRLAHQQIDGAIATRFGQVLAGVGLDSPSTQDAWTRAMLDGPDAEPEAQDSRALAEWLQRHDALHQAEYFTIGFGTAPDMSQVDFRNERAFYTWMSAHASIHDELNRALGLS